MAFGGSRDRARAWSNVCVPGLGIRSGASKPRKSGTAITDVEGVLVGPFHQSSRGALRGPCRRRCGGPVAQPVSTAIPAHQKNIFYQALYGGGSVPNGAGEVSGSRS